MIYTIVLLLVFSPAWAQQQWVKFASGTAFYIDRAGHLITNAHVVKACESIAVRTPQGEKPVTLIATDTNRDLALLQADWTPPAAAPMRWNIKDLGVGDRLYLYGFPGPAGSTGTPSFVRTAVVGMHGPTDEPELLQLASAAQQGNSGGPVLDGSGNVIAVISGRTEIYKVATTTGSKPELIGKSDIAITLAALQDFLSAHQVSYYQSASGLLAYAEPVIARNAAQFIIPIRCIQGRFVR